LGANRFLAQPTWAYWRWPYPQAILAKQQNGFQNHKHPCKITAQTGLTILVKNIN